VTAESTVSLRPVTVADRVGKDWIIAEGLKRDERVVVEGIQKVRPGMQVNPKRFVAKPTQ
jgi:membrane fusion protein (multidrug efflux system)